MGLDSLLQMLPIFGRPFFFLHAQVAKSGQPFPFRPPKFSLPPEFSMARGHHLGPFDRFFLAGAGTQIHPFTSAMTYRAPMP